MKNSSSAAAKNQESKDLSHRKNSFNEESEESQDPSHSTNSSNEESSEESQDPSHSTSSSNEESSEESHKTNSSNEQVNISEESQDLSHITTASDVEDEESQDPSHTQNSSDEDLESEVSQDLSHLTDASDEESEESQDPSYTNNSSNEESSEESQDLSHNSSTQENSEESQDPSLTMNSPKKARTSSPSPPLVQGSNETITEPFPWATNRRAIVHDVYYLYQNNITTIKGRLRCKNCKLEFDRDLDLDIKSNEVMEFMEIEDDYGKGTAPAAWMNPVLETCQCCGSEESIEPCLEGVKKKNINSLFLYLSQLLGCCDSHQLKYFLKHNNITIPPNEDKGLLLYSVYTRICDQLVPN